MTDFVGPIPACPKKPLGDFQPALPPDFQAAAFINVSVRDLRKWRGRGEGRSRCKLEGYIQPVDELHTYIAANQRDLTGQDNTRSTDSSGGARHG